MTGRRSDAPLRVHITGVSDVHNFGDALFPLIAAHRLAPHGISVTPASPTGAALSWPDALPSVPIESVLLGSEPTDGLLIGGGHIVMCGFRDGLFEGPSGADYATALPSLWLGASLAAALRKVPVAWNAPGVFSPLIGADLKAVANAAIRTAGYLSVRDAESRAHLGDHHERDIQVVPDTVFGVEAMWPRAQLEPVFRAMLQRKSVERPSTLLAVHFRGMALQQAALAEIAARLDDMAGAHGVVPLLVAVGPGVRDDETAREIALRMTRPHILLDDPRSLKEIVAALALSDLYVGQSLHGYVVAVAYGVPGILIGKPPARRFRGVLKQIGRPQDLFRTLPEALEAAACRLRAGAIQVAAPTTAGALDRHWASVLATFRESGEPATSERLALPRRLPLTGLAAERGAMVPPAVRRPGHRVRRPKQRRARCDIRR
ncbi:polysaccharide pyruvyl transferase family protein [Hansschlegelia zhihuaiae]|uniref:Polysaccharide pyruvyl transferase family protein n=1 Tax=Hansschlegelia zhihuaiae TaxID=405005 RepID=A0A4Q0ML73_9HYPH|nr:polysaccharide pyruvyl transferase family protein [Hansschlegelia zhihuaiae]RXF74461.1 polysaccharide pyruvyl transferase family protein [Hansschlegelia zhihuaiae]